MTEYKYEYNQVNFKKPEKSVQEVAKSADNTPKGKETLIGILLGLGYLFIFPVLAVYIALIFTGSPTSEFGEMLTSSIGQIIAAVGTVVGMMFAIRRIFVNVMKGFNLKSLLWGLGTGVVAYVVAILCTLLDTAIFGPSDVNANQQGLNTLLFSYPVLGVLFTCLVAPVVEELIFRFFIFGSLKKRIVLAYIISAVTFGGVHLISSFSAFAATSDTAALLNDLRSLLGYVAGGAVFCVSYHKSGNIAASIFGHILYNSIVTVMLMVSFNTSPFMIKNVKTADGSITVLYHANTSYEATLDKVEVLDKEDNLIKTITYSLPIDQVKGEIMIDGLDSDMVYTINIHYSYELDSKIESEMASTYAKAIEKK